MISPCSPRVQVTSVTAVSGSAQYRAMVPPVASVSSSGCACTSSSLRRAVRSLCIGSNVRSGGCCRGEASDQRLALGVVAGHRVPLTAVDEVGDVVHAAGALLLGELAGELRAPGAEPAAAGWVRRARHVAD